jgi:hypothetical protein
MNKLKKATIGLGILGVIGGFLIGNKVITVATIDPPRQQSLEQVNMATIDPPRSSVTEMFTIDPPRNN